ncbi:MAG TPA: transferrin receptor-like dimerization domain-containing protein, partial [Acidobacteriota bacterium]|nr:transferrin receptor-like dimerization domain-containing protein [Acidobacteriota bacterium]
KEDHTSGQKDEQLPIYNAYSTDGDVTGDLVYVNYGVPKDYEELALRGIDVRGKIVIARYGESWRGVKPKVAAEHGAIGCILYSDPNGDGYYQGDVYPKGGWRSESGAQRGSVMDFSEHDGDPLTPFVGATENAQRIPREKSNSITKIPVLPISYRDALPFLKALAGPIAPEAWRGNLPISYHMGPGPARVHLKLEFNWNLTSARDVIARLKGSHYPDQWIIRGNHHDAWVNGALDPVSGMVAVLEEARAVSELVKSGWHPARTLIYAAWDGEEPGLLGSTEWVEQHREELQSKAIAYINSDSNSRGFLTCEGSQTLEKFFNQVARDVQDPEKKVSALERQKAYLLFRGTVQDKSDVRARTDLRMPALGSGSDYTAFLQFAGIASLNIGFGGEEEYGQYHSIYDSYDHFTRFCDPTFEYGLALARTGGRIVLRLANAEELPFEFTGFADDVSQYLKDLQSFTDQMRSDTEEKNRRIDNKEYEAYFDPNQKFVAPQREDPVPHLNFAPLQNAVDHLQKSAGEYRKAYETAMQKGALSEQDRAAFNDILMHSERALTRKEGLPGRAWFTHQIYAPGVYTGYAAKALPSVREAVEQRKWKTAEEQIQVVAQTLEQFTAEIEKARALLSK